MKDFYNGLFALGLVAGAGACVLVFILLEWFGFEISASSGFLAALLGAFVGGSFTIAAQMMAADAAAKEAKKERDEQSLKIEKAVAQSIFLKIHDYYNEVLGLHGHYSKRISANSLRINGKPKLASEYPYPHRRIQFSIEEKSVCIEWKNHKLLNDLSDLEGLSANLEVFHSGYSPKIRLYIATLSSEVAKDDKRKAVATRMGNHEEDVDFQELSAILEQFNRELAYALDFIPQLRFKIEAELSARFGIDMKFDAFAGEDAEIQKG